MDRSLLLNPSPAASKESTRLPPPVAPQHGTSESNSTETPPSTSPAPTFLSSNTSSSTVSSVVSSMTTPPPAALDSHPSSASPPDGSPEGTPAPHTSTAASRKPRTRSMASRTKPRQASFNSAQTTADSLKPLNTHSPIAVAAAAAVTSDKIKKLLVTQGPLPIRHITSHLASTIPGFGELSLSKQRRLIIAVLDGPRSEFVKIGWGRWAVSGDTIIRKESLGGAAALNASAMRQAAQQAHRQSISKQLPDTKLPLSPPLGASEGSAVFSDSESEFDDDDDDSEIENTDEEDWQSIGPAKLRQTSPREQDAIFALVRLKSN